MGKTAKHTGGKPVWNVRPATPEDVPAVAALLRGLGWFAFINDEAATETENRVKKHLCLCMADDSHSVLVAEDVKGAIMGYVAVHWLPYLMLPGPEGYVSELFVTETARSTGAGTRLLEAVRRIGVSRGCSRLMLVNRKSRESYKRGFYRKLGWEEREEFANFVLHLPLKS
jgi:GNAT superfamily N-acetyltransferase